MIGCQPECLAFAASAALLLQRLEVAQPTACQKCETIFKWVFEGCAVRGPIATGTCHMAGLGGIDTEKFLFLLFNFYSALHQLIHCLWSFLIFLILLYLIEKVVILFIIDIIVVIDMNVVYFDIQIHLFNHIFLFVVLFDVGF